MTSSAALAGHNPRRSLSLGLSAAIRRVLRIPLMMKVMGANAIIVAMALVLVGNGLWGDDQGQLLVVLVALTVACAVNLILVRVALSPINELERVSEHVSQGEFGTRATSSMVADTQLLHLTNTVNSLLDSLAVERRRIQKLGVLVVSAQDAERARMGRELHDSIAQTLAAVGFQLSAAGAGATDDDMRNTLSTARVMIGKAIEEVRSISYSLHPRVAEDLGLVPALEYLAQRTSDGGTLRVNVTADIGNEQMSTTAAATIFRVAQESLKTAELRGSRGTVDMIICVSEGNICLSISDDTHELDTRASRDDNSGAGLTSIMDRVALSGGIMRIETRKNGGTRVTAELPRGEGAE